MHHSPRLEQLLCVMSRPLATCPFRVRIPLWWVISRRNWPSSGLLIFLSLLIVLGLTFLVWVRRRTRPRAYRLGFLFFTRLAYGTWNRMPSSCQYYWSPYSCVCWWFMLWKSAFCLPSLYASGEAIPWFFIAWNIVSFRIKHGRAARTHWWW